MLLLLLLLAAVPIIAYRIARTQHPSCTFLLTGIALGLVISPLSLGLYATFFIPYIGLVPGMIGLALTMFHGSPGFHLAQSLGIIPLGVVEGIGHFYIEVINGLIWAVAYGCLGWIADWFRAKNHKEGFPHAHG